MKYDNNTEETRNFLVRLPASVLAELDKAAEHFEMSRNQAVCMLLDQDLYGLLLQRRMEISRAKREIDRQKRRLRSHWRNDVRSMPSKDKRHQGRAR